MIKNFYFQVDIGILRLLTEDNNKLDNVNGGGSRMQPYFKKLIIDKIKI